MKKVRLNERATKVKTENGVELQIVDLGDIYSLTVISDDGIQGISPRRLVAINLYANMYGIEFIK